MRKLSYIVAAALVLATLWVAWSAWRSLAAVEISTAGMLAMVFGALVTVALGVGLMAPLLIGDRSGFDDRAGRRPDRKTGSYPDQPSELAMENRGWSLQRTEFGDGSATR